MKAIPLEVKSKDYEVEGNTITVKHLMKQKC